MGATVACFGLVVGTIIILLASRMGDEVGIQSFTILGGLVFAFSYPLAPLLIKLGILGLLVITWPLIGDHIIMAFHRQTKK